MVHVSLLWEWGWGWGEWSCSKQGEQHLQRPASNQELGTSCGQSPVYELAGPLSAVLKLRWNRANSSDTSDGSFLEQQIVFFSFLFSLLRATEADRKRKPGHSAVPLCTGSLMTSSCFVSLCFEKGGYLPRAVAVAVLLHMSHSSHLHTCSTLHAFKCSPSVPWWPMTHSSGVWSLHLEASNRIL